MRALSKPRKNDPLPGQATSTPAAHERKETRPSLRPPDSGSKCPRLRDLLGNYSEQTGSFFG